MAKPNNGYSLSNKMRRIRKTHPLTPTAQALFYELVSVNNENGWRDVFPCKSKYLESVLGVTDKTLSVAREQLINSGLIFYRQGKSRKETSLYSFAGPIVEIPAVQLCTPVKIPAERLGSPINFPAEMQTVVKNPVEEEGRSGELAGVLPVKFPTVSGDDTEYNYNINNKTKTEIPSSILPVAGRGNYFVLKDFKETEKPDADGVRRNYPGLLKNLQRLRLLPEEFNEICRLSNNGAIGHPVWEVVQKAIMAGTKLHSPGRYILSQLKK